MTRRLVFVHGRSQQNKNKDELKAEWIGAWKKGLAKSGLSMPIDEQDVVFPYYGDVLFGLAKGDAVLKGADDIEGSQLEQTILTEMLRAQVDDDAVAIELGRKDKAAGDWPWIRAALKLLDKSSSLSALTVKQFTRDVDAYLRNPGVRDSIDDIVKGEINTGEDFVLVGHSLGTVVTYNILRSSAQDRGWTVPLHVTVGSPLGVESIRQALAPLKRPSLIKAWFNARDEADIIAIRALDDVTFPGPPGSIEIENDSNVKNWTDNRHGIVGYLDDANVASRICQALQS